MSISPISAIGVGSVAGTNYLQQALPTQSVSAVTGSDESFGASLASSIDGLSAMQANSSALALKAVSGNLADVHDYTIASTQAAVALELTATVRNRAVEAFNEIMRMQA